MCAVETSCYFSDVTLVKRMAFSLLPLDYFHLLPGEPVVPSLESVRTSFELYLLAIELDNVKEACYPTAFAHPLSAAGIQTMMSAPW